MALKISQLTPAVSLTGNEPMELGIAGDKSATTAQIAALSTPGFKNYLINGDFQINQRAFAGGALAAGVYGFDRWKAGAGGCNVSLSGVTLTHTSGPLVQVIEAPNLASRSITVSVDNPSGSITVNVEGVTGTITTGSGRRGITLAVPSGSTGNVTVMLTATGVAYQRAQVEIGSVATVFEWRPAQVELALCQRYFARLNAGGIFQGFGSGIVVSGSVCTSIVIPLPSQMRAIPAVLYNNLRIYDGAVVPAVTSMTYSGSSQNVLNPEFTCSGGGLTAGRLGVVQANNSLGAWLAGDAEL